MSKASFTFTISHPPVSRAAPSPAHAPENAAAQPLAVDFFRHLFQHGNAAGVVFDQIVVGGEDGGDFALDGEWRERNWNTFRISVFRFGKVAPIA